LTKEETIDAIERVLQKYAELQINLASSSARAQIATAIMSEIEESVPGLMSLSELTVLPPYDLADEEAQFSAPSSEKKICNDL
tara:strand:- start:551 stop:799 length:249 start_codon:yes stop_codon:yes gene_type:complete